MIVFLVACAPAERKPAGVEDTAGVVDDTSSDTSTDTSTDTSVVGDPFVDVVVSFTPGDGAGFGQDRFPDVVYGPPDAPGTGAGSLDVLSLGNAGEIIVEFTDILAVDGEGIDLIVFENAFTGWVETGVVAASGDGETWAEWPCDTTSYVGCAGVAPVYSNPENGIDPTDHATAGGDAFDLADVGLAEATYVRVRDSGANSYDGTSGGFDLDAMAVVNGRP